jgi:POT family proton-dependent oligopeptide transporter
MNGERHPRGLTVLFLTEMWERFSFYLMLGILYQYLSDSQKGGMGWSDEKAAVVVGSYIGLVYFTPFIGGLVADRLLGCRRTILIGGVLMMIGHLVLAWPTVLGLYLGLGFLILGNGAFKPNISTLLGNLYPPGSKLRDAGYNIFYMGINLGAFICNFVAAFVRNYFDQHPLQITSTHQVAGWHAAFATAAIGMFIGLVTFSLNYRRFARADEGPPPEETPPVGDSSRAPIGPLQRPQSEQVLSGRESTTDAPSTSAGWSKEEVEQRQVAAVLEKESLGPLWLQCLLPAALLGAAGWFLAQHVSFGLNPPTAAFIGACLPAIAFYLRIWRDLPTAEERGRIAALLVIFAVSIVFWMTFQLSATALTVWTRDCTSREPEGLVRAVTDRVADFAENAPPSYYFNAGPETPRPDPSDFTIVSDERYKGLQESKQLNVKEGEKVFVTRKMFDDVYKNTNAQTPLLPPGKQLKLVNPELYNSINGAYVILFTPLVVGVFHFLRNRNLEPSTPAKIGLGLVFTAGATLVMLAATYQSSDGAVKASSWWLFGVYAVITVGELCLSPMGLSLVNKMSPAGIRAFMMGGWFLSTSIGNKLSGIFGEVYQRMNHLHFWLLLTAINLVVGGFVFVLLPWLNRQMADKTSPP